jgi:N-acetyltransferase 10
LNSSTFVLFERYYEGQMTLFADDQEATEEPEVKITEAAEKVPMISLDVFTFMIISLAVV